MDVAALERMDNLRDLRNRMVEEQIAARGVRDPAVLEAMRRVPREEFVPPELRQYAYEDGPLAIGSDQTISQPYIVALMVEALRLQPGDRVLEVGAGSGYAAAVLAEVAASVDAVERHEALARSARERLERLGYQNVTIHTGDGTKGLPERAPFDAIVAAAAGPRVPDALLRQLAVGGRMVIPVGASTFDQRLIRLTRSSTGIQEESLEAVRFVPLIGQEGWPETR